MRPRDIEEKRKRNLKERGIMMTERERERIGVTKIVEERYNERDSQMEWTKKGE
jgi:hypothetical protein